ncbi:MAG: glucans biosynthesis glucosyltransferase MdoH [Burkholderiaceae bacterium]|nr:glucans biosynthesis glucosyltransferase MdoH [Burkholderiaceae bacterium]MCD8517330.1 glucans biosynthesis glucosyltransferase MdoH [Burkholderiaceae bacterium]MCD8537631.1 glucans biosynthesis glucosyltransferase MdoH [Burkholderiaceae bacterium]MCD8566029.1 glucans biosynthesis glucosyltransferase MdoH [Burkholderiaceae bacterium]
MTRRRVLFVLMVALSVISTTWLMALALAAGGWSTTDVVALLAFIVVMPWLAVGFCNAVIGFALDVFARDPLKSTNPMAVGIDLESEITSSTALLLCIRNEMPARLVRNLDALARGLLAAKDADQFHVYVLSDTTDAQIAEQEVLAFEQLAQVWQSKLALTYRRRTDNRGFKAGNIQDFCERWGADHEFALVLDADSLMSAKAVRRLVLTMQANPTLGILQGLVVGLPATSAFTRLFQFGMRLGMRSYTLGSAWWQGDCGPYWGHNAVLRLAPFIRDCQLPVFVDRKGRQTHILSHDQVEAVLMRRAGYEVRVYPFEDESYEENPPNLIDFVIRDLRWCAGNMQYWRLLFLPGLKLTSRIQLILAMLMFVGAPAWMLLLGSLGWTVHQLSLARAFDLNALTAVLLIVITMAMLPKLAAGLSVLLRARERRTFGGGLRFVIGFVAETVFSLLITPVLWVSQTVLLAGLPFGKRISWAAQNRDQQQIAWQSAIRAFGLHTAVGLLLGWLWLDIHAPATWWIAYFIAGLWFCIPLAVITSWPAMGHWLTRMGLAGVPQEFVIDGFLSQVGANEMLTNNGSVGSVTSLESGQ